MPQSQHNMEEQPSQYNSQTAYTPSQTQSSVEGKTNETDTSAQPHLHARTSPPASTRRSSQSSRELAGKILPNGEWVCACVKGLINIIFAGVITALGIWVINALFAVFTYFNHGVAPEFWVQRSIIFCGDAVFVVTFIIFSIMSIIDIIKMTIAEYFPRRSQRRLDEDVSAR